MLRKKPLWEVWMAQPACEAALAHHETQANDRFVPITLSGCGDGTRRSAATEFGAPMSRSDRRLA